MEPLSKITDEINDLQSSLRATEFILLDTGYLDQEVQQRRSVVPRPGIRIRGELSFRGKEMTQELFRRLDEDGDGGMTFDDFRAMKSLKLPYSFLDRQEFNLCEAWRLYLADCGVETDRRRIQTDLLQDISVGDGLVREESLVRHRVAIELADGLAADLRHAQLGYLPPVQVRWGHAKALVDEAFMARKPESTESPDRLNRDDASFILCNVGVCYSKGEYMRLMIRRARFEILSDELLARALRNDLFLSPNRLGGLFHEGRILMPEDELDLPVISMISPQHLLGWLFSDRPKPTSPVIYQNFLRFKYTVIRYLRKATHLSVWLYQFGTGIRDSFLFKGVNIGGLGAVVKGLSRGASSAKVPGTKRDKVMWKSSVRVGDVRSGKGEDGSGFYWKYSAVDKPSAFFERLHLPPESGSCIAIDFTVRRDATDSDVKNTANYMKRFLSHHFAADLSLSQQFKGILVFPVINEGDGSRVVRCALCYKRIASIDMFFEYLHMDCTFTDIVTIFTGSFFSNVHVADMVDSAKAALDDKVTFTGTVNLEYKRGILLSIIRRARLFFSAGVTEGFFSSRLTAGPASSPPAPMGAGTRTGGVAPPTTDPSAHIRHFFPQLATMCDKVERFLSGFTSMSTDFRFKNLSDALQRWGLVSRTCAINFPPEIASGTGTFYEAYQGWSAWLSTGASAVFSPIRRFLERKNEKDISAKIQRSEMSDLDLRREENEKLKSELTEKLKGLGIATENMDNLLEPDAKSPEEYAEDVEHYQLTNDAQAYQTLELMHQNLSGIHSGEVVFGKCRIGFVGQGLDVFDLLPEFESIIELKRRLDIESRAATAATPVRKYR